MNALIVRKNVVIIMLDRAIGYYVPFFMEERPELQQQFDGFTFYSNTLSFGPMTNTALPAVYGGYEYTPALTNQRTDKLLVEKHNEALLMMPILFSGEDYEVTVRDLELRSGAGFITVFLGSIVTMPGLPKKPNYEIIDVDDNNEIVGLF